MKARTSSPASLSPTGAFKNMKSNHDGRSYMPKLLAIVVALSTAYVSYAQNVIEPTTPPGKAGFSSQNRYVSPVAPADGSSQAPTVFIDGAYAANANIGALEVEVTGADAPADGRTPVVINIKLVDKKGQPLQGDAVVTIENSGGRILLPGAETPQFGPATKDADRNVPGTQLKIVNGAGSFSLIAPDVPGDVKLRLSAGGAVAEGTIGFDPDVREMIASGLVEGAIRLAKEDKALLKQARLEDGFEQEIKRFSREFQGGKGTYAARAAFFLKGRISGQNLLTLAYDSDKETRARLLRDIKPEEFYPVYGDASVKGFEAQSSDRLYVRVDNKRSYLLYGDYSTGSGFSQQTGAGVVASGNLRQLGAYNRTLTGARGHLEGKAGFLNVFGARDTLKQLVEEYAANGTSGPISVKNASALENSEKVEIITRDKNARDRVIAVTILQRLVDYTFEPFNGRILLARPIASLDPNGNPVSIRITYEVDQGGDPFWVGGIDGQANIGEKFTIGGGYVKDRNPLSPFQISSVNAGIRLGEHTSLIAELAQSKSRTYSATPGTAGSVFPTGAVGETTNDLTGRAARVELNHDAEGLKAKAWYLRSNAGFSNANAGLLGNRLEAGVRGQGKLTETLSLNGQLQRTEDTGTTAKRDNAAIGLDWKATGRLNLLVGVRKIKEEGNLGATAALTQNPSPGSFFNPTGGFSGTGPGTVIDPATGLPSVGTNTNASTTFTPSVDGPAVDATTVYLGAKLKLTDKFEVSGLGEVAVQNNLGTGLKRPTRVELGASYQLAERTRAYLRGETQTGLAASTSLDRADKSTSVLLGIDSSYADGQAVFSEYRLRDASNGQDAQWATGLRNTWQVREGLLFATSAEYLKVFNGGSVSQASDAYALGVGMDYTAAGLWKGSWKLDWRRVNDNKGTEANERSDSYLATLLLARKLDRDWTLLARNYALWQKNYAQFGSAASPAPLGTSLKASSWQDRIQLGAAYRPVDSTNFDALFKLEYKLEDNINHQDEFRKVFIMSTQGVWHPSRPWWLSGRFAAKNVNERFFNNENGTRDTYKAFLVGGRLIYDVTENWDLGVMTSVLQGKAANQDGSARQYAAGLEVGYNVATNLWISAGYNWTGFNDKDLAASEYTNRGAYLRLRYKFDEDLFKGKDTEVNRSLPR